MITSTDIERIRETLAVVSDEGQSVGFAFYRRLFELEPQLESLLDDDPAERAERLLSMLHVAPMALEVPSALIDTMRELGARHFARGVREEHYGVINQALLETIASMCEESWDAEADRAWRELMTIACAAMVQGRREAELQPA